MADASQHTDIQQTATAYGGRGELVSFARITVRSLPQLALFNAVISVSVAVLLALMGLFANLLLASKGTAFTTANAADVLLSWQGALLVLIVIVLVAFYITFDLFAHIYFCAGLLEDEEGGFFTRAARAVKRAFGALPRFLSPGGVPTLIYIVLLAPLVGIGFSIGLTRDFYIPTFIMSVVEKTPLYAIAYQALVVVLFVVGVLHFFTVFGVLLDDMTPGEARRMSRRIERANAKSILISVAKALLVVFVVAIVIFAIFIAALMAFSLYGESMPAGQAGFFAMVFQGLDSTPEAIKVSTYHFACFFVDLVMLGITFLAVLLLGSCAMMFATHLYKWHSTGRADEPRYPMPTRKRHRVLVVFSVLIAIALFALASLLLCVYFELTGDQDDPVAVVAHRMGGDAAPENSLEGLEYAIEQGCYGAETDIQRTKDGRYIINHDDTFERLTGVNATSQDLTLAEVEELRLHDPGFPDQEVKVPTLEEALDVAKGHIKLFVEFKGKTADHEMVDDAVRIVREHDAVDDVVFISLNYDCISYAKETYPEFDYGLLFFAQYGDVSLLECDILLAEEEAATGNLISSAHEAGKELGVWTANDETVLRKVLDSGADYVITDKVALATNVQEELDSRDDFDAILELVLGDMA